MADECELVGWEEGFCFFEFWEDVRAGVDPGGVEAHVDCAVIALGRLLSVVYISSSDALYEFPADAQERPRILIVAAIARVRQICLRHSAKVHDGIGDTVRASERDDDAFLAVIQSNVAAAIAQQGSSIPCSNELEFGKVFTSREAGEGLADAQAGEADAVGDVYDAGEFFKLCEEGGGDGVVCVGVLQEWDLELGIDRYRCGCEAEEQDVG